LRVFFISKSVVEFALQGGIAWASVMSSGMYSTYCPTPNALAEAVLNSARFKSLIAEAKVRV
jgi:hypothetical protein